MSAETQVLQAIAGRRSVRRFLDTPIPSARMEALITAACAAPSASNRQDWLFTLVTRAETRRALAAAVAACWERLVADCGSETIAEAVKGYATNLAWFDRAPVVVVLSCRRPEAFLEEMLGPRAWAVAGTHTSAAMAAQNLLIAAHALGLGACCLTGPLAAEAELKAVCGLGERRHLVCLVALGYPAEAPEAVPRKPLAHVMRVI